MRRHDGALITTLQQYRDRYAQYKSDIALQAMHAARAVDRSCGTTTRSKTITRATQSQALDPAFALRRAAAYQAYWEHMPFPLAARPRRGDMRIHDRYDWGRSRVSMRSTTGSTAIRRPARAAGRGGSNEVMLQQCPQLADANRSLLGAAQERWLSEGWSTEHRWNLLAQQTLMARFSWRDPSRAEGPRYWTDGWDGYPASRARVLGSVAERKVANLVAFGGDVHANYVTDLKLDYDDAKSPVIGTEFCGTSITSESLPQDRVAAALPFNPHIHYGRTDQRGYVRFRLDADALQAQMRVVDNALDPMSGIQTAARFVVEAGKAGATQA